MPERDPEFDEGPCPDCDPDMPGWRTAKSAEEEGARYPCKTCNPTQFYKWATGHYAADHDRGRCIECNPPESRPRRRRRVA